jgi:hypothetical protein
MIDEAKQQILSYIQSNYILKSDVEKIIGDDEPRIPSETNNLQSKKRRIRNAIRAEQRIKASQYGLTKK